MATIQLPGNNRFTAALIGSIAINALLWGVMAAGASRVAPIPPPRLMELSRVVIDKDHKVTPKIVKPITPEVKKKAQQIKERPEPPKPVVHQKPQPPPPPIRNKVITAPAKSNAPANPNEFTAHSDGNTGPGKPVNGQANGDIKPDPPKTDPPKTDPPKVDPPKTDPPKVDPPKPDPPKPDPPKPDPPKPKGPTKDAEATSQVNPEIPDNLKSQELKTFVRVKVLIDEDGSFEVILRTSSGNTQVDDLIVNALKRWKWKPALKDGEPVKSTKLFKFEIEVK